MKPRRRSQSQKSARFKLPKLSLAAVRLKAPDLSRLWRRIRYRGRSSTLLPFELVKYFAFHLADPHPDRLLPALLDDCRQRQDRAAAAQRGLFPVVCRPSQPPGLPPVRPAHRGPLRQHRPVREGAVRAPRPDRQQHHPRHAHRLGDHLRTAAEQHRLFHHRRN